MANIEAKKSIVEEIQSYMEEAHSAILVDYRGLTVAEDTELRKQLREEDIIYKVYKNTLLNRAFEGTQYEELAKHLDGPTAIAFGTSDATAPARIINGAAKEAPAIEFKAGVIEGKYFDGEGIAKIAKIPSKEVLISRLLGSLQAPVGNFARVIKQIAEKKEEAA